MLTSCPECRTTFRVTQEHLALRRGLVRCGHCGVVFNAYDSLLAELVTPPEGADSPEEDRAPFPEEAESDLPEPRPAPPPQPQPEPAPPPSPASSPTPPVQRAPEPAPPERSSPQPDRSGAGGAAIPLVSLDFKAETSESILLSELPTRVRRPPAPRGPRFYLQVLAALLLTGVLLVQTALFLRGDLAAALPGTRPLLETLCRPLGCQVPLPRLLDKSAIAASSLEHDTENKSREHLSVLLANRTGQTQAWPHIVLILTDVRDAPVAQRIFTPTEYLAKGSKVEAGMAANLEQEIRLDLDTGPLAATGYALDLAYR